MNTLQDKATDTQARWLRDLGVTFCTVHCLVKGAWIDKLVVDDPSTFDELVDDARRQVGAKYVCYSYGSGFVLLGGKCGYAKTYPTREAAEMVAMHDG